MSEPTNNHLRPADIAAGKALTGLREKFLLIGKRNVIAWKAWLVIGLVAGISTGVIFVANRSVRFETSKAEFINPRASRLETIGDQKTLVFLVQYLDSQQPPPFSREEAREVIFNGGMQLFYNVTSYGNISFSGDVYGWYTLPRAHKGRDGSCQVPSLADVGDIIAENGIDLISYDRLIFISNSNKGDTSCSNGVWGSLGKVSVPFGVNMYRLSILQGEARDISFAYKGGEPPFSITRFDFSLIHEMGHNLGVFHANGLKCGVGNTFPEKHVLTKERKIGFCSWVERGNHFDAMDGGIYSMHFNASVKERFGWLDDSSILEISETGRYTIQPLELRSGMRMAKIQTFDGVNTPFFLDYRTGVDFDGRLPADQNGLFVYDFFNQKQPRG